MHTIYNKIEPVHSHEATYRICVERMQKVTARSPRTLHKEVRISPITTSAKLTPVEALSGKD